MTSHSGRYTMTFNGEIYNFQQLRAALPAGKHQFRGHSDTEVMLAAFEEWGIAAATDRFLGMFVFGVWDRETRTLTIARDHVGIKPLYYSCAPEFFAFGSELKPLIGLDGFDRSVDLQSLDKFLRFGFIEGPKTIFRNTFKLQPGCMIVLNENELRSPDLAPKQEPYWSLRDTFRPPEKGARLPDGQLVDALDKTLSEVVSEHMISDVPLGAFLSGGVDSSVVVAIMCKIAASPVRSFSIGFKEPKFDEAPYAREVANHLGCDHSELYIDESQLLAHVDRIADIYDEPFGDSSQLPSMLVSQLTRQHVTVSLSGDGGDELFAGYNRYRLTEQLFRWSSNIPKPIRGSVSTILSSAPRQVVDWLSFLAQSPLPGDRKIDRPAEKLKKVARLLNFTSIDELYSALMGSYETKVPIVHGTNGPPLYGKPEFQTVPDFLSRAMLNDQSIYLPDDNLVKVDRASMAVALEVRVPLLDRRVVELANSLPIDAKLRNGTSKWLLRQVLERYVPRSLIERPKRGFSVPIDTWIRGPLRGWAEELLSPAKLSAHGLLATDEIRRLFSEHNSGRMNHGPFLWNVLVFQQWYNRYIAR